MKNYQKGFAPLVLIIIIVAVTGIVGGGVFAYKVYKDKSTQKINVNESVLVPTGCTDSECFVTAIKNCSTTNYQTESSIEFLGSNIKSNINFELSQSGGDCLLSMNLLSYNISPSQGLLDSMKGAEVIGPGPEEIYPKLNSEAQVKYVGKNGVCNITNKKNEVVDLTNKNSLIALAIINPDYDLCSGDLFVKPDSASNEKASQVPRTVNDCKDLSFRDERENCFKLAVKNVSDCNVLSFPLDRQMCIKQLAIKQKDSSICSLVAGQDTSSSIQTECFGEIAILKNDYSICSESNFDKLKNNKGDSSFMALECIKKYCSIRGVEGWWGCSN